MTCHGSQSWLDDGVALSWLTAPPQRGLIRVVLHEEIGAHSDNSCSRGFMLLRGMRTRVISCFSHTAGPDPTD